MPCLKRSIKIFYITDDESEALVFNNTLSEAGYENPITFVPKNCAEILECLGETGSAPPDLVILDTNMAGMDSPSVLREIRRDARLKDLPVILVTGANGFKDLSGHHYPGLKSNGILVKPISVQSVTAILETFGRCTEEL